MKSLDTILRIYICPLIMAAKLGALFGGGLGWAFGGPIGALVGAVVGYMWDSASLKPTSKSGANGSGTSQGDFYISLLVLTSAMMKADDKVLKSELNYVKQFLKSQFGENQTAELLKILKDLLQKDVDLGPVCNQIKGSMSHAQRLQLVHYLVGIANADGHIHEQEWSLLESIARRLNVNHKDLESLYAMYQVDKDRYYRILEIEKRASKEEIKKAYRKMVKKYHPDKLGDIGEDAKNTAIEKFRMVQEAYDELNK